MTSMIKVPWENVKICHLCKFQGSMLLEKWGIKTGYLQNPERGSETQRQRPLAPHLTDKETESLS